MNTDSPPRCEKKEEALCLCLKQTLYAFFVTPCMLYMLQGQFLIIHIVAAVTFMQCGTFIFPQNFEYFQETLQY